MRPTLIVCMLLLASCGPETAPDPESTPPSRTSMPPKTPVVPSAFVGDWEGTEADGIFEQQLCSKFRGPLPSGTGDCVPNLRLFISIWQAPFSASATAVGSISAGVRVYGLHGTVTDQYPSIWVALHFSGEPTAESLTFVGEADDGEKIAGRLSGAGLRDLPITLLRK